VNWQIAERCREHDSARHLRHRLLPQPATPGARQSYPAEAFPPGRGRPDREGARRPKADVTAIADRLRLDRPPRERSEIRAPQLPQRATATRRGGDVNEFNR
jgi:hypothetical protein